jgi:hypothetical protein
VVRESTPRAWQALLLVVGEPVDDDRPLTVKGGWTGSNVVRAGFSVCSTREPARGDAEFLVVSAVP